MDTFTREHLSELVGIRHPHCVSLFLPTHRSAPNARPFDTQDPIRWKNLMRVAEDRLQAAGAARRDVEAVLAPARARLDDQPFWQFQSDGLAAFAAPGVFRTFRVPLRFEELVVVAPGFHLKPLLPLLVGDGLFHILALSQNEVRLIEARRDTAGEVDLAHAPRSLREALRFDEPEKQLQHHAAMPRGGGPLGAVFHGHGVGADDRRENILRFCQQVDQGLTQTLRNGRAPLVLAAVESLAAIYREASSYRHLVDAIVAGNPEGQSARELHQRAWPLVEPILGAARDEALRRFQAARHSPHATSALADALHAAADGRIDALFVPVGEHRWGTYDGTAREAVVHEAQQPGDEDLLNVAAVRTLMTGGAVFALPRSEMPDGAPVAALFRY